MQDYIYDENGNIIETNYELNYQYDTDAFNDICKDNAGIECNYEDLM